MIAVALSIMFPGLGQIYYGKWGRAWPMLIAGVTPLYPLALVWSVFDAHRLSREGIRPQFERKEALTAIVLFFVVAPLCIVLLAFTASRALAWLQDAQLSRSATIHQGAEIASALSDYRAKLGRCPKSIGELIGNRPLRAGWLYDGWGRPYSYELSESGSRCQLLSAGRDGKFGTDDDLDWHP
jgi:hypothetical protein